MHSYLARLEQFFEIESISLSKIGSFHICECSNHTQMQDKISRSPRKVGLGSLLIEPFAVRMLSAPATQKTRHVFKPD